MRRVVDADHEPVRRARPQLRQLEGEWRVAALMLAQLPAIEPRGGAPVGSAEHQEDALPPPCVGDGHRARVPTDVRAVRDTGERGAPGERHQDLTSRREGALGPSRALPLVAKVERKLPAAVEVDPLGALEIGARVLGEGNGIGVGGAEEQRGHPRRHAEAVAHEHG